MSERSSRLGTSAKVAGVIALAAFLPGCIDLPDDAKSLLKMFIVVLSVNTILQVLILLMLLFYFLPFTRPVRLKRPKRKK